MAITPKDEFCPGELQGELEGAIWVHIKFNSARIVSSADQHCERLSSQYFLSMKCGDEQNKLLNLAMHKTIRS